MLQKRTTKIIFLDIDGVLWPYFDDTWKQESIDELKRIVQHTSASIVLSSTWRFHDHKRDQVNKLLEDNGMEKIIGQTPIDEVDRDRTTEIFTWLDENDEELGIGTSWVAIDDMDLLGLTTPSKAERLRHHFVRTATEKGLLSEDADKAIRLLNTVEDSFFAKWLIAYPMSLFTTSVNNPQ
eukprot:CAMPEP_0174251562 /NCGR_PEP_ID=MMETSP0439-20130205/1344_1 /TAXON_ID=0 /ORGANISM="Stereomyxa ramosa, Strain Chinc5" /LENGTH=180 /DNA_ID=CAMNT_0015331903 /DNA_START=89 /DNA_END=631 /DNA_ORIENTATION=-